MAFSSSSIDLSLMPPSERNASTRSLSAQKSILRILKNLTMSLEIKSARNQPTSKAMTAPSNLGKNALILSQNGCRGDQTFVVTQSFTGTVGICSSFVVLKLRANALLWSCLGMMPLTGEKEQKILMTQYQGFGYLVTRTRGSVISSIVYFTPSRPSPESFTPP